MFVADALAAYYASEPGHGRYAVTFGADRLETSILTAPGWLDLACPLVPANDRLRASRAQLGQDSPLDPFAADSAVQRLAETVTARTRVVNMPLYRLDSIDVAPGRLGGTVGLAPFVEYALTMDLLESELVDSLAAGRPARPGELPLRDHYLPDTRAVLDVSSRLCAGGTLALCAIARPA